MAELLIRKYRSQDKSSLFKIGADTAFFGDPIEAYLDDRQLFLDAFYAYYTDIQTDYCWVACSDDQVVGFLAGCEDTRKYSKEVKKVIIPRLIIGLLKKKYIIHSRSINYFLGLLSGVLQGGFHSIDYSIYPAHLHINIDNDFRGYGLGKSLIRAYIDQLNESKISGVHLQTTSQNIIACQLYEKMGFQLIWYQPNHFWTKWFGYKVDDRCYGRRLL